MDLSPELSVRLYPGLNIHPVAAMSLHERESVVSKPEITICIRAEILQKTLGTRCAAGFMRNRGFTLEQALAVLAPGAKPRS